MPSSAGHLCECGVRQSSHIEEICRSNCVGRSRHCIGNAVQSKYNLCWFKYCTSIEKAYIIHHALNDSSRRRCFCRHFMELYWPSLSRDRAERSTYTFPLVFLWDSNEFMKVKRVEGIWNRVSTKSWAGIAPEFFVQDLRETAWWFLVPPESKLKFSWSEAMCSTAFLLTTETQEWVHSFSKEVTI